EASGDASWVSDEVVDGYTAGAARDLDGTLKAYVGMARARERERLRPHLAQIACPVLLLLGGAPHKGGPPPAEVTLLAQSLPAFTGTPCRAPAASSRRSNPVRSWPRSGASRHPS